MQSTKLKNIDKWAKDRPFFISIISQQVASSAEACYEFLKAQKLGKYVDGSKETTDLKQWLRLYKNHRILESYIVSGRLKPAT